MESLMRWLSAANEAEKVVYFAYVTHTNMDFVKAWMESLSCNSFTLFHVYVANAGPPSAKVKYSSAVQMVLIGMSPSSSDFKLASTFGNPMNHPLLVVAKPEYTIATSLGHRFQALKELRSPTVSKVLCESFLPPNSNVLCLCSGLGSEGLGALGAKMDVTMVEISSSKQEIAQERVHGLAEVITSGKTLEYFNPKFSPVEGPLSEFVDSVIEAGKKDTDMKNPTASKATPAPNPEEKSAGLNKGTFHIFKPKVISINGNPPLLITLIFNRISFSFSAR